MIDADTYQGSFQLEVLARLTAGIAFIKNSEKSNIGRPAFKLSIRVKIESTVTHMPSVGLHISCFPNHLLQFINGGINSHIHISITFFYKMVIAGNFQPDLAIGAAGGFIRIQE